MTDTLLGRLDPSTFRDVAQLVLEAPVYEWIASGSGVSSASDNEDAFRRWRLRPRVLVDVSSVDTSTALLGSRLAVPIVAGPIALLGAIHPSGELGMAEGLAASGSLLVLSIHASTTVAEVRAAQPDLPMWLQIYNWAERQALIKAIAEAEAANVRAIVPLVNTPRSVQHVPRSVGFRPPPDVHFAMVDHPHALEAGNTWPYLSWLRTITELPIVPKGILTAEDAKRAVDVGVDGIIVSNHGGRQLGRSVATLTALPEVVTAVPDAPIILDGGVRTGTDVLIALALGASAVMIARPLAWGLAVGGAAGVRRVMEGFRSSFEEDAALCGIPGIGGISRSLVVASAEGPASTG